MNGADTVAAHRKEKSHAVSWIELPVFLRNVKEPPLWNQAIKKWEEHLRAIGLKPFRKGDTDWMKRGVCYILMIVSVHKLIF